MARSRRPTIGPRSSAAECVAAAAPPDEPRHGVAHRAGRTRSTSDPAADGRHRLERLQLGAAVRVDAASAVAFVPVLYRNSHDTAQLVRVQETGARACHEPEGGRHRRSPRRAPPPDSYAKYRPGCRPDTCGVPPFTTVPAGDDGR